MGAKALADTDGTITFQGAFTNSGQGVALQGGAGTYSISNVGSSVEPFLLEVPSADLGLSDAGFTSKFAALVINITGNSYTQLVDKLHSTSAVGAEALYANTLALASGATFDLNQLHAYVRAAQVSGTVTGGTLLSSAGLPPGPPAIPPTIPPTVPPVPPTTPPAVPPANTPPVISDVGPVTVAENGTAGPLPFTVGDAETPAAALMVTVATSDPNLLPSAGVVISGAGADRTVTITPAAGQTGAATVILTVTNAGGQTATDTFTVTVTPPPPTTPPTTPPTVPPGNTPPAITDVGPVTVAEGGTAGPLPFTVEDTETSAAALTVGVATSDPNLLPASGITLGGSGADRTVTVTPAVGQSGTATVTLTVTDADGLTATDTFTVTVTPPTLPPTIPPPPPGRSQVLVGYPQYAAGSDAGGGQATLSNPDGSTLYTVTPFPGFTGGVRTAAADFNGDGVADLVAGTGPGGPSHVVILDGKDQHILFSLDPFEAAFTGGVYVAAGDVTGGGYPDLVITPDEGGGPRVEVFDGKTFTKTADFYGIDDPAFRGGARAAVGDVNGDGVGDLIVSAGFQGGPRVAGFDGRSLASGTPQKIFGDFFAFEQSLRNGVFLTVGDVNGDGYADVIVGGGPGGGPRVTVFDGKSLLGNQYTTLADFFAGDPNNRGGVRLAVKNLDGDTRADLVVGSGTGAGSRVTAYLGKTLTGGGPSSAFDLDAFSGFAGGVFVG